MKPQEQTTLTLQQLMRQRWAILGAGREAQALIRWCKTHVPELALAVFSEQPAQWDDDLPWNPMRDTLHIGPFEQAKLAEFQVLVKSPGISPHHPALAALPAQVRCTSTTNLWLAHHGGQRVIGITGTKGKSTTSALTAHLLRAAGLRVELVGNIGVPVLERIDQAADWWVLELSSYQCADLSGSLELGVVLSLFPEHLDWHGSETRYLQDKLRLLGLARRAWAPLSLHGRLASLLSDQPALWARIRWLQNHSALHPEPGGIMQAEQCLLLAAQLPLRGLHNLHNICIAWELARYAGVNDACIVEALQSFQALPHRLEEVGVFGGLRYINDSISTAPHAAVAALEACAGAAVTILVGGHDRQLSWQHFSSYLQHQPCHALVAMGPQGERIRQELVSDGVALKGGLHWAADLEQAMATARQHTPVGGIVLLSPGAPSYGAFKNFEARGAVFRQLARQAAMSAS